MLPLHQKGKIVARVVLMGDLQLSKPQLGRNWEGVSIVGFLYEEPPFRASSRNARFAAQRRMRDIEHL